MAELRPEDYSIIWIAPLAIEAQAAIHMLDRRHNGRFLMGRGDDYVFPAGEMCGHNVVIATLPAGQEYGTGSAAALVSQAKKFFPNFWFGLLVGVAAGLPNLRRNPPRDIRLGDVLVSIPDIDRSGAVAYDLGRDTGKDELELLRQGHVLAQTEPVVRSAIGSIKLDSPDESKLFLPYYEAMKDKRHSNGTFVDPGQEYDKLYQDGDDGAESLVERQPRPDSQRTLVWYGSIGSGEKLMKNAARRDELRDRYDIIGLEMEAAGTMNRIPVGVIRAACDYGDKRKNKEWQPYAAAMAAAYAKAVLFQIPPKPKPDQRSRRHSTKRRARDSTDSDSDSDDDSRNKRSNIDGTTRASSRRDNVVFRGQGNQNVGSGSISIGGSQTFR
ncbi:purine and uridine phosphorylase [Annulohypoxylon truncatum]|uniref:purine and uridine phosphorylase n=1 Tax=Annulohypoxylon truncatum TaxID=327061 RepID=UPI002007A7BC|nr:purine and uridine phosphorylase [Annulohypoxylon truncatum]KAI1208538.1 purine and uridine phosphorylase [Annulohypoxylon truncatum]